MKALFSFVSAVLLIVGSAVSPVAQTMPASAAPVCNYAQDTTPVQQEGAGELLLIAIVSSIDHANSLVSLDTEVGPLQVLVSPDALRDLQEGDVITISVIEEEIEQELV